MTVLYPEATKAQGATSVLVVQTIAIPTAPDLSSELNAGSTVNVSCFLYGDINPTIETAKGTAPRRLCTTEQFEEFGNTTFSFPDISYVYDPQEAESTDNNKALAALEPDSEVFFVVRRGLDAMNTALAAGQYVDVWKVRLGPQNRSTTGDGEFDQYAITQSVIVLSPPKYSVQIVA